jgi:hypothetical protein
MNIELHIERLVLDGLPLERGQGAHVQAAVEAELSRLLSQDSMAGGSLAYAWPVGGAVPSVPAAPIQLRAGARPADIGGQIARSVYGGIGGQA